MTSIKGIETIGLPVRAIDQYSQHRLKLTIALRSQRIRTGDLVLFALDRKVYHNVMGDLLVVCDVEAGIAHLSIFDLLKLPDRIRPSILEIAIKVAYS